MANERNFLKYWTEKVMPSILSLKLTAEDFSKAKNPFLTIHGTRDRNAPCGAGRDWAMLLPDARLVTIEGGAHAPWIEAPKKVFAAIRTFLNGSWPEESEKCASS